MSENITPIKAGILPAAVDDPKTANELYVRLMAVVDDDFFNTMTLAACLGTLEIVKHTVLVRNIEKHSQGA